MSGEKSNPHPSGSSTSPQTDATIDGDAGDVSTDTTLAADSPSGDVSTDTTLAADSPSGDVSTDATLAADSPSGDVSTDATLAAPGVAASDDDAVAVTPEALGRYRFAAGREHAEIGRGGIGRVLVALDTHVGREIAIKELLLSEVAPGSGSGSGTASSRITSPAAARFLREARVTGQLEHPNIVPVYELGQRPDGTLYYAMKLVRGRTLAKALRAADSLEARLQLLSHYVDLCQAIAYAHSRGVIHRDIKPDNVMLGEFGETVVLDWGLAKAQGQEDLRERELRREIKLYQESEASRTLAGATLGTPAYMSPEQAQGDLDHVDEQSDVWALGAVLYELLTGTPPHSAKNVQALLTRVVEQPVPPVREREPAVPPELAAVAQKALRRDRARRYASARELAREIEAFQSGARVASYPYSSWELLKRFVSRNKALSVAAVLLLLVLAVSTGVVYGAYRRAEDARGGEAQARTRAVRAGRAEHQQRLRAQDREREAHLNLALAYQEKADRLLSDNNYTAARIFASAALLHNPGNPLSPRYRASRPVGDVVAARGALVAAQSTLFAAYAYQALRFERRIRASKKEIWSVAYFPDGARVASGGVDGTVHIFRVSDGAERAVLRGSPKRIFQVSVSPDGRQVAAGCGDGQVRIWDVATRQILQTLSGHRGGVMGAAWSPDGKRLASSGMDGTARIWDPRTGKALAVLKHRNPRVWSLAWSPDGARLATTSWFGGPSRVNIWDVATRQQLASMTGHFGPVWSVAWSPDGKELATGGVDKTIRLWSVAEGRQISRLVHHRGDVTGVTYLGGGTFLASVSVDRTVALWLRPSESVIATHRAHRHHIWSLAVAPGGHRLVTAGWDGDLRVFRVRTGGHARMFFTADRRPAMNLRLTPRGDAALLAVGNEVRIVSLGAGPGLLRKVGALRGHTGGLTALDVTGDGRYVATASRDGTARIWDLAARRSLAVLRDHHGLVRAVAFTPDGKLLATGGKDRMIRLWRVPSGKPAGVLSGHVATVLSLAVSPDGKRLASFARNQRVRLWSLPDGAPLPSLEGVPRGVQAIAFAKGHQTLLLAADSDVQVWDTRSRKRRATLRGHRSEIMRLRVTADRRYAITSARDNRVYLWDLTALRPVQYLHFDMLPLAVDIQDDHQRFAVSMGVPLHVLEFKPTLWKQDPQRLLKRAESIADLRLKRFRLQPNP